MIYLDVRNSSEVGVFVAAASVKLRHELEEGR
jgi:hypothetical protein